MPSVRYKGKGKGKGREQDIDAAQPEGQGPADSVTLLDHPSGDDDTSDILDNVDPSADLEPLTARSLAALRSLARYGRRKSRRDGSQHGWRDWPDRRRAAVMVALFGGKSGELNVLLSTRSMELRVNPGEVALPGGKMEPTDTDLEHTARREAFEEIGLPMSKDSVRHLCNLPPFLSRSAPLLVTPVVCLLLDSTLQPNLNPAEVSNVFSHPLYSFLTERPPSPHYVPNTVYNGTRPYRMQYDIQWLKSRPYRLFRFEGRLNPIWGFTADILIHTAMIAYGREPEYERRAPGQLRRRELIRIALDNLKKGTLPDKPSRLGDAKEKKCKL